MKICPICKTKFKDTTKKCRYCNELLITLTQPTQTTSVKHSKRRQKEAPRPEKTTKFLKVWNKYRYWVYVILITIIILIIALHFLSQKSNVNKNTEALIKEKLLDFDKPDTLALNEANQSPENILVASVNVPKDPGSAEEWNNKALTLWVDGKYTDPNLAIEYLNNAIKLHPEYTKTYYNRGLAYHNLNQYQRRVEDYTEAIRLKPDYVNAYYNRGTAYLYLGDNNLACVDLQKACELGKCDQWENARKGKFCR
jgi:tetratricopeptide (TPR) repeat protein